MIGSIAMKKYNKITPEGTGDLLFEDCMAHRKVEAILSKSFSSRGFQEVVTPGIEFYDVMDPEVSGISPEIMYKTTNRHGRLVPPCALIPPCPLPGLRLQGFRTFPSPSGFTIPRRYTGVTRG